jgi:ribonuclease BN (tRNA processing enzyme)
MYKTAHPEYTVSYRFEERPTGKVFVFLTDHENTDGFPNNLLHHLRGADLLVQDGQYSDEVYRARTSGFGHGTPEYCVKLAQRASVKRLGITHHDPDASDVDVEQRIVEAKQFAGEVESSLEFIENIFVCADYQTIEV